MSDLTKRQVPDGVGNHGHLSRQNPQRQKGAHLSLALNRQLLVIVFGA